MMMITPPPSPEAGWTSKKRPSSNNVIVVSNRLPITIQRCATGRYEYNKSSGGLVSGLSGLDQHTSFQWDGWPGLSVPDAELLEVERTLKEEHSAVPLSLDDQLADRHYNGFSNGTLWPLLHYQDCFAFQQTDWKAYQEVNQRFASRIAAECGNGDLIWVHDYHLFLLPGMLRREAARLNKTITIGFFLHTPFPASDHFKILPIHRELLSEVLCSDVIGFHTGAYADNFRATCADILGLESRADGLCSEHHFTQVGVYPIGIDPDKFSQELAKPEIQELSASLRQRYGNKRIILGVDRLDYIKGLPRKIHALDRFLFHNPQWIGHVTLVQVAIPSRENLSEYQALASKLETLVQNVNYKYGFNGYQPIHLVHSSLPFEELVAHYAVADVCLITSTRDGMNLVASEYVASQHERHGVLLLSEFAGAAEQLKGSVCFNPWDVDGIVASLSRGLTMGSQEREQSHKLSASYVMKNTSAVWGRSFVADLQSLSDAGAAADPYSTAMMALKSAGGWFKQTSGDVGTICL